MLLLGVFLSLFFLPFTSIVQYFLNVFTRVGLHFSQASVHFSMLLCAVRYRSRTFTPRHLFTHGLAPKCLCVMEKMNILQ